MMARIEPMPAEYYKNFLNPQEQRVYRDVVASLLRGKKRMHLALPFGSESRDRVISAVHRDHPEIFYVDFWHGNSTGIRNTFGMEHTFTFLEPMESVPALRRKMDSAAEKILRHVSGESRVEQYYELGSSLSGWVYYTEGNPRNHTALGALVDGEAVCEGIAKAYLLLCRRLNLPCALVVGGMEGGSHAWNMVELEDGQRFYVDITNRAYRRGFFMSRSELSQEGYFYVEEWKKND